MTAQPGITQFFSPIQFYNYWLIDTDPNDPTILRISEFNESLDPSNLALVMPKVLMRAGTGVSGTGGSVHVGANKDLMLEGVLTFEATPCANVYNDTWQSKSQFAIATLDPSNPYNYIDDVCLLLDPTYCGTLFRKNLADTGIFDGDNQHWGYIDYGFIQRNSDAHVYINASRSPAEQGIIAVAGYTDYGDAVPCIVNPTNPPPPATGLWLAVYNGSCTHYTGIVQSVVPLQRCFPMTAVPWQLPHLAGAPDDETWGLAALSEPRGIAFTVYSDAACTIGVASISDYTAWGCNVVPGFGSNVSFYWALASILGA